MRNIDTATVREHIYTTASITITEKVATVSCIGAGGYTVTIPTAQDATGLIFCLRADDSDQAGAAAIVIANSGEAANMYMGVAAVAADVTLNTLDDWTVLYSDGNNWYQIVGGQT